MTKTKFKSHEQTIFEELVADVFRGDLNDLRHQERAVAKLEGVAFALKAIGSDLVEGEVRPDMLGLPATHSSGMDITGRGGPVFNIFTGEVVEVVGASAPTLELHKVPELFEPHELDDGTWGASPAEALRHTDRKDVRDGVILMVLGLNPDDYTDEAKEAWREEIVQDLEWRERAHDKIQAALNKRRADAPTQKLAVVEALPEPVSESEPEEGDVEAESKRKGWFRR